MGMMMRMKMGMRGDDGGDDGNDEEDEDGDEDGVEHQLCRAGVTAGSLCHFWDPGARSGLTAAAKPRAGRGASPGGDTSRVRGAAAAEEFLHPAGPWVLFSLRLAQDVSAAPGTALGAVPPPGPGLATVLLGGPQSRVQHPRVRTCPPCPRGPTGASPPQCDAPRESSG